MKTVPIINRQSFRMRETIWTIASLAADISASVVMRLKEKRMDERAWDNGMPISSKMREGSKAPEEQAEPWLTEMP